MQNLQHEFDGMHLQDYSAAAATGLFTAVGTYYLVTTDMIDVLISGVMAGWAQVVWVNWLSPYVYGLLGYLHPKID